LKIFGVRRESGRNGSYLTAALVCELAKQACGRVDSALRDKDRGFTTGDYGSPSAPLRSTAAATSPTSATALTACSTSFPALVRDEPRRRDRRQI